METRKASKEINAILKPYNDDLKRHIARLVKKSDEDTKRYTGALSEEFKRQVQLHADKLWNLFGLEPHIFRNTELIYNNELASAAEEMGYRGVLAEAYGEEDATRVWQRGRLERLRSLPPGGVVAFAFRASTLSFIKTKGGENILIREVEDVETGGRLKTPSEVSKLLGLSHGDEGRLVNVGRGVFKFQRLS